MTFLPFQSDACVPQYIHFILMYEAFTTKQIEVLMGCRQSLSFPFFFFFSLFFASSLTPSPLLSSRQSA